MTAFDVVAYCDVHGLETGTIITNIDGPQLPMLFMDRTGLEVVSLDPVSSARRRFGGFGQ